VVDLTLAVDRVESNPQLAQIVPPNEVVVLISFEITIQDVRGMMNLCIPFNSIERIGNKLSANNWVSYGRKNVSPETVQRISRNLRGSAVELVVQLADARITAADLLALRVGDIITTDKDVRSPLAVSIEGVLKYHAQPGAYKGRKAIRIEQAIPVETLPATAAGR
jgi:flagellar motor switch protein FliM